MKARSSTTCNGGSVSGVCLAVLALDITIVERNSNRLKFFRSGKATLYEIDLESPDTWSTKLFR